MRNFNPIHLAAAVAIALAGPAAVAQTTGATVRTAPSGVTATPSTSPTSNSPSTTGTTTSSSTTSTPGVGSSASVSGNAGGTNQTTVDPATTRPGSFEPGGAFGPQGTNNLGTNNQGTTNLGTDNQGNNNQGNNQGFNNQGINTVPGNFVGGVGSLVAPGDTTTMTGNPSQQTIVIQQPSPARSATPLLDQTTRDAQARETRRRDSKQEPRIIGIAPNTDRDLTNQMPDDRIIRY